MFFFVLQFHHSVIENREGKFFFPGTALKFKVIQIVQLTECEMHGLVSNFNQLCRLSFCDGRMDKFRNNFSMEIQ